MNAQNLTAQILTLSLLHLSLIGAASKAQAGTAPTSLKQRVELFGSGTELKLKLKSGEKLHGSVESIGNDSFVFTSKKDRASREIAFNDLENANYPKRGYKTDDTPDPAASKRMVVQLGVGEHIMVKVSPEEKVRGHIREIHADHFVIQPDGQAATRSVPYDSIWKVNKNLSLGATVAIIAALATAVVLILVLTGEEDIDVLPN